MEVLQQKQQRQKTTITRLNSIDQHKSVAEFMEFIQNQSTKSTYKSSLQSFFDFLKTTPERYITCDVRLLENGMKIQALDRYGRDVLRFFQLLLGKE